MSNERISSFRRRCFLRISFAFNSSLSSLIVLSRSLWADLSDKSWPQIFGSSQIVPLRRRQWSHHGSLLILPSVFSVLKGLHLSPDAEAKSGLWAQRKSCTNPPVLR